MSALLFKAVSCFGAVAFFCSCATAPTPERATLRKQMSALHVWGEYERSSNWKLRLEIENAAGLSETIASRIFRAFHVISLGAAPREDHDLVARSWRELDANPAMTISVLYPIVFETSSKEERAAFGDMSDPPVSEEHVSLYLTICSRIACTETNGFALARLENLRASDFSAVSEKVPLYLDYVAGNNWQIHRKRYLEFKSWQDLAWFESEMLRRGLHRKQIEMYLGFGTNMGVTDVYYFATEGRNRFVLKLHYWEDDLWTWESATVDAP